MTADKFKESIVEMVAFEGIALRFFSTPASKKLLGEMAAKLGVSLARDRVRSYVIAAAEQLQLKIKADLKDKFIHLKFDTATRIRTNYLGINVRYLNSSNEPITQTLAIKDTRSRHTSFELKEKKFKIKNYSTNEGKISINKVA